jgi:hypothetical protein
MAFYMKMGSKSLKASGINMNGAPIVQNNSAFKMSPFNVGPCVNPGEPNPNNLPPCNVAQTTKTTSKGTKDGVTGTFTDTKSITHKAIDTKKESIPTKPITKPGKETPPKKKPPSKNQCGKDVSWSDSRCKAYAKKRGGTVVKGKYIPGTKTPSTIKDSKPAPPTTTRTYDDDTTNKRTFVPDPKPEPKPEPKPGPGGSVPGRGRKKITVKKPKISLPLGSGSSKGSGCPGGKKNCGAVNK